MGQLSLTGLIVALDVATAGNRASDAEPGSQALHELGVVFARAATRLMIKVNDVQELIAKLHEEGMLS